SNIAPAPTNGGKQRTRPFTSIPISCPPKLASYTSLNKFRCLPPQFFSSCLSSANLGSLPLSPIFSLLSSFKSSPTLLLLQTDESALRSLTGRKADSFLWRAQKNLHFFFRKY